MATKKIKTLVNNTTFSLSRETIDYDDGRQIIQFWLYDNFVNMNISMRAKTEYDAFTEALQYYQNKVKELTEDKKNLESKVNAFLGMFHPEYTVEGDYPDDAVSFAQSYK